MNQLIDAVGPRLALVLDCVTEGLEAVGVPVCRAFVHPGAMAPWDACGTSSGGAEGQAWVGVERVYPVNPFPQQDLTAQRAGLIEFAADIIVGVLRCAATVDDNGNPPPVDAVMADAMNQTRDLSIVRDALVCCYYPSVDSDPGEFRLGTWEPLGPQGGCVGGQWRATIRIPGCPCPS